MEGYYTIHLYGYPCSALNLMCASTLACVREWSFPKRLIELAPTNRVNVYTVNMLTCFPNCFKLLRCLFECPTILTTLSLSFGAVVILPPTLKQLCGTARLQDIVKNYRHLNYYWRHIICPCIRLLLLSSFICHIDDTPRLYIVTCIQKNSLHYT